MINKYNNLISNFIVKPNQIRQVRSTAKKLSKKIEYNSEILFVEMIDYIFSPQKFLSSHKNFKGRLKDITEIIEKYGTY